METQEPPSDLLNLVVQKHYRNRPDIFEDVKSVIRGYVKENLRTYELTLGFVYEKFKDLPSDILLYFLTTVPMPQNRAPSGSVLFDLISKLDGPSLHSKMRPVLLEYLNDGTSLNSNSEWTDINSPPTTNDAEPPLIDTNSLEKKKRDMNERKNRQRNKRRTMKKKVARKRKGKKTYNTKSLTFICAKNIHKHYRQYRSMYEKLKTKASEMVTSNTCDENELAQCENVLKDVDKKMLWLNMFKTGDVPLQIFEEEYGQSDILHKISQYRQNTLSKQNILL